MTKLVALVIVLACVPAHAETPLGRIGATVGLQQTDRSAWVFGPSLEVHVVREFSIRGEAQLELGDVDSPFGDTNILSGDGPHVNHVMFGPTWRPVRFARYDLAVGAEAGVLVMHSVFAPKEFTKGPAAGVFVQAGKRLGPVVLALQLRLDVSGSVDMGGPDGVDVPTTSGRFNLAFEVPIAIK
ncbi:MAG: hypothetical protein ABI867_41320 [Kofleriaceae bacterium]